MTCDIIIHTHSDYKDIWPIMLDFVDQNIIARRVGFSIDIQPEDPRFQKHDIYVYDDKLTHPARLVSVLKRLKSDYVLFFHDIDIITRFDSNHFDLLLKWMTEQSVDRFALGMFPSQYYVTSVQDMPIAKLEKNMCSWFTTPYDPAPSIWKRSTFLEIMTQFSNETYKTIEFCGIQEALSTKKVYGFAKKSLVPLFTLGRPFTEWIAFCHLFCNGKWSNKLAWQSYRPFMEYILEYYNIDIEKRGFAEYYHGVENGLQIT